jgi:hypothetical protein
MHLCSALRLAPIGLLGLGLTACGAATPPPASPGGETAVVQMDGVVAPVKAPAKDAKNGTREKGEEGEMGEADDSQAEGQGGLKDLTKKYSILGVLSAREDSDGVFGGVVGGVVGAGNDKGFGAGGLGLSGIGTGGGGTGQGIGIGSIGTIGVGSGTGSGYGGRYGVDIGNGVSGASILMNATAVIELGDTATLGVGIEQAVKVIRGRAYSLRECYEEGLRKNKQMAGTVGLRLVVGRSGDIAHVRQTESDLVDKEVIACIAKAMKGAYVGQPSGGLFGVIETVMEFRPAPKK